MTAAPTLAEDDDSIDYDAIYANYMAALVDKLRGLTTQLDYLDLWVPDEDPLISVRNMLDSAATLGRSDLQLRLGKASAAKLDAEELLAMAQRFGAASVSSLTDGLLLCVTGLRVPGRHETLADAQPEATSQTALKSAVALSSEAATVAAQAGGIPAAYVAGLERAAACLDHMGDMPSGTRVQSEHVQVMAADASGASLQIEVELASHQVQLGRFLGGTTALERGLLNELCRVLEGLPILEAREHGILHLEYRLRDRRAAAPVRGIVTPQALGDLFELPTRLLRNIFEEYRAHTGFEPGPNRYNPQPKSRWLALPDLERRAWLQQVMANVDFGVAGAQSDVTVAEIRDAVRVILNLPPTWSSADRQRRLMMLEDAIKLGIDGRLEVFAEELKDQNRKRRLAVVDEPRAPAAVRKARPLPEISTEEKNR